MAMITVKCPVCGENFQADDSREFGFCSYCGAKVEMAQIQNENSEMTENIAKSEDAEPISAVKPEAMDNHPASMHSESVSAQKVISRKDFERKKAFERRCNEQIAFLTDQMNKPDKKKINSRDFFNAHILEWQEALYTVQKELRDVEIVD